MFDFLRETGGLISIELFFVLSMYEKIIDYSELSFAFLQKYNGSGWMRDR